MNEWEICLLWMNKVLFVSLSSARKWHNAEFIPVNKHKIFSMQ